MKKPELVSRAVKVLHHIGEVPGRTPNAMDEQDGHSARVVRFGKVNSQRIFMQKIRRSPHASASTFAAESHVIERNDFAKRNPQCASEGFVFDRPVNHRSGWLALR